MLKCLKVLLRAIVLTSLVVIPAAAAHAYVLDGDLSDWGVTPFSDWVPDSSTAFYNEENNYNPIPPCDPFQEYYDLEAIYFDSDVNNFYFAIVTSNSYRDHWASEDMGIDLNGDGLYEFGVNIGNAGAGLTTNTGVWDVDEWMLYKGIETSVRRGTRLDGYAGAYELYNQKYSKRDPDHYIDEPGIGYDYYAATYILEGRLDRALFGDIACGADIELHLARITCVKDIIKLNGKVYGPCSPVIPEPGTMLLFGSSLIGLVGMRLKKKKA